MPRHLAHVALLALDYDERLAYFVGRLGFVVLEDTSLSATKRWVLVAAPGAREAGILLARAATPEQRARSRPAAGCTMRQCEAIGMATFRVFTAGRVARIVAVRQATVR